MGVVLIGLGWLAVPDWADIMVPAGFLVLLVASSGRLRWIARPYPISGEPPRWIASALALICLAFLVAGVIAHAKEF